MSKLTSDQVDEIVQEFQSGVSVQTLADRFGVAYDTICYRLRRRGVKTRAHRRDYSIDHHYFDTIDSEEKAYTLGFLFADGSIATPPSNRVKVDVNRRDREILERFASLLHTDYPISEHRPSVGSTYHDSDDSIYAELGFSSRRIHNRLTELGCTPRKSLTLQFPTEIPSPLLRHFLRGYYDGDGCFYHNASNHNVQVIIVSTIEFCEHLRSVIVDELDVNIRVKPKPNGRTAELLLNGGRQCRLFLDWLYEDATLYLDRKRTKYLCYLTTLANRQWSPTPCHCCDAQSTRRGYCGKHYQRMMKRMKSGLPYAPEDLT